MSKVSDNEMPHMLEAINVSNQYINNCKVASMITASDSKIMVNPKTVPVISNDRCITTMQIWGKKGVFKGDCSLTYYDRCVQDAVYTLINQDNKVFTLNMLARILYGRSNGRYTEKALKRIEASLEKLSNILIRITVNKDKGSKPIEYKGSLFTGIKTEIRFRENGGLSKGYLVEEKPALYAYAESIREILSIPMELFEIPALQRTEQNMLVMRYAIQRTIQIKSNNKLRSTNISFYWQNNKGCEGGLYMALGFSKDTIASDNWRKKIKPRLTRALKTTLDYLVTSRVIAGYDGYRRGGSNSPALPVTIKLPETRERRAK